MRDLELQEKFELEVLERLNSKKLLRGLVFGGGTMLRLCWGLNRFSVDLDFWTIKTISYPRLFKNIRECLEPSYTIIDATNKFYTLLFEIKSSDYPRKLKIEIRKEKKKTGREPAIAFSAYSTTQVLLDTIPLQDMMQSKIAALIDREEIRDAFDIEYLLKKGARPDISAETAKKVLKTIESLTEKDYTVKLGSLLAPAERKYYTKENFKLLKSALTGFRRGGP